MRGSKSRRAASLGVASRRSRHSHAQRALISLKICSSVKRLQLDALAQADGLAGAAALADAGVHVGDVAADVAVAVADLALLDGAVGADRSQRMQPMQVFSLTTATAGSRSSSSALKRPSTLAPVALAMATASGMSFGAWQAPARKTPAVLVSTGRSLGWASLMKPCSS